MHETFLFLCTLFYKLLFLHAIYLNIFLCVYQVTFCVITILRYLDLSLFLNIEEKIAKIINDDPQCQITA